MDSKYVMINAIVNQGFASKAIEAATNCGAKGATIISAKGSGSKEAALITGINVSKEKESVIILVKENKKDSIMRAIAEAVGLNTEGQGIVFCQNVNDIIGVK